MSSSTIIVVFFLIFAILGLLGKNHLALNLIVLLIPLQTIFFNQFGLNAVVILGYFVGQIFHENNFLFTILRGVPLRRYIVTIFLIISVGILVGHFSSLNRLEWFSNSPLSNQFGFIIYNYSAIALCLLIVNHVKSEEDIKSLMLFFNLSAFYTLIAWFGFYYLGNHLPDFIRSVNDGGGGERFSGLWGDYELVVEYCFINLIFALIILVTNPSKSSKLISLTSLIITLPMVISTGTRSFIIIAGLYAILVLLFILHNDKIHFGEKIRLIYFLIVAGFVVTTLVSQSDILLERFSHTINNYQLFTTYKTLNAFEALVNRNYSTAYEAVLEVGGLFGKGSFFVHQVDNDTMVYHCLYFQLIVNFGIVGLIVFVMFFVNLLSGMLRVYLRNKSRLLMMFWILLVVLLIDQVKIDFMRSKPQILVYWMLFGISLSIIKTGVKKEQ